MCNLKNYKTTKLKKNSKQTNIKENAWKRKNENMKLEKIGSLFQVVVLFVGPASYKNKNTRNIYVKISSKILGFPTHLFQKTKLRSVISSIISSSFHTRNIFSLILAVGPNGHNSNPLNLF